MKNDAPLIRLCPSEDGTFRATWWNSRLEDYVECTPEFAIQVLSQQGAIVEVALNDPNDKMSHFESRAKMKKV